MQKKARRDAVQLEPNKFIRTLYVVSGIISLHMHHFQISDSDISDAFIDAGDMDKKFYLAKIHIELLYAIGLLRGTSDSKLS